MELAYTRKPTIRLIATDNAPADKVAQIGYGIEVRSIFLTCSDQFKKMSVSTTEKR